MPVKAWNPGLDVLEFLFGEIYADAVPKVIPKSFSYALLALCILGWFEGKKEGISMGGI